MTDQPKRICKRPLGDLWYNLRGEGPPTFLIMGYLARGVSWRLQVEELSPYLSMLWFDHRGVGESRGPAARDMSEFVDDCLALMDLEGWESAHIVGISMGGMIAQHLAVRHPHRVRSLTLMVTHAGGLFNIIPPLKGIPLFLKVQFARSPLQRIKALSKLLIPRDELKRMEWSKIYESLSEDFSPHPPIDVRLNQMWAIIKHKTKNELHQITHPTLIVQAQEDLLISPRLSEELHMLISSSTLLKIPNAGHGLIRQPNTGLNDHLLQHILRVESSEVE